MMEYWGVFWGFILAFACFDGLRDWANGDGLNHTFRSFVRLAFIILLSFHEYGFDPYTTAGAFKLACYRFAWFWLVFDVVVNTLHFRKEIFRYREITWVLYLGNTAFTDWIFRAVWGVATFQSLKKPNYTINTIGATITQYIFKILLLIITYQWATYTSDHYLF